VALVGGSGGSLVREAAASGADLYVTGDVKHHEALEASPGPMVVVDAGHGATEKWILPEFASALRKGLGKGIRVNVFFEEDPLRDAPQGDNGGEGT
jgi:putative NIF3 family GTP cyclohydrolase 1 type 2